jgi:hypothetical protein
MRSHIKIEQIFNVVGVITNLSNHEWGLKSEPSHFDDKKLA